MRRRLSYQLPFIASAVIVILICSIFNIAKADSNTDTAATREKSHAAETCGPTLHSILSLKQDFNTVSDWYAVAYEGTSTLDGKSKDTPSRLCFRKSKDGKDENCYVAQKTFDPRFTYAFWGVLELKVIPFFKRSRPARVLLFSSRFFGGGSDHLDLITLWSYDKKSDRFIQITPKDASKGIALTSQGEYRLLDIDVNGIRKILVETDYVWGENESHFGRHFYRVFVYVYRFGKGFVLLGQYKTKKKYPGLDTETLPLKNIDHELKNIKRFVRQKLK